MFAGPWLVTCLGVCMYTAHGLIKLYYLIVLEFAKDAISFAYGAFSLDGGLVCCNCFQGNYHSQARSWVCLWNVRLHVIVFGNGFFRRSEVRLFVHAVRMQPSRWHEEPVFKSSATSRNRLLHALMQHSLFDWGVQNCLAFVPLSSDASACTATYSYAVTVC